MIIGPEPQPTPSSAPIYASCRRLTLITNRQKVPLAAALSISPAREYVGLHHQTLVNAYFNSERYALFLWELLHDVRGPLLSAHDNGNMHRGQPVRELCREFQRLHLCNLPPYAPELNPWNWCKDKQLSTFVPHDAY